MGQSSSRRPSKVQDTQREQLARAGKGKALVTVQGCGLTEKIQSRGCLGADIMVLPPDNLTSVPPIFWSASQGELSSWGGDRIRAPGRGSAGHLGVGMGSSCLVGEEPQDQGTSLGGQGQPKSPGRPLRCPLALLDLLDLPDCPKPICLLQPFSFLSELLLQEASSVRT